MKIFGWFRNKGEVKKIVLTVKTKRVIPAAYKSIKSDLDSLRLYDMGKKDIHAPDLSTAVRRVPRAS